MKTFRRPPILGFVTLSSLILFLRSTALASELDLAWKGYYPPASFQRATSVKVLDECVLLGTDAGLMLVDGSARRPLGEVRCGSVSSLVAREAKAYLSLLSSGIEIIDVSNPLLPCSLGKCDTPGTAYDLYVEGNHMFVADGDNGLCIVDVSNPRVPFVLNSLPATAGAYVLTVSNHLVFLSQLSAGLRIVDVTDLAHPREVGIWTNEPVFDVTVVGSLAYLACNKSGVVVLDMSTPTDPQVLGTCRAVGAAQRIRISGSLAFVTDVYEGLKILDVADPRTPRVLGTLATPGNAEAFDFANARLFLASGFGRGLQVIDISKPTEPTMISQYKPDSALGAVALGEHIAYVASTNWGLVLLDVTAPDVPRYLGHCSFPGTPEGITVAGSFAYVAAGKAGLQVIDVTNHEAPRLVGACDTIQFARAVVIAGDLAYVADGSEGLRIIDVSTPAAPRLVGSYDTPCYAIAVPGLGKYAYVAGGSNGLVTINVSDPANPRLADTFPTSGSYCGIAVHGSRAYLADTEGGIDIFDLATPQEPKLIGWYWDCGWIPFGALVATGSHLFVPISTGIVVLEISNPADPQPVGSCRLGGYTETVIASAPEGNLLGVLNSWYGLRFVEWQPALPRTLTTGHASGYGRRIELAGNYAYAASDSVGVLIYDFSDLSKIRQVGGCPTSDRAYGVTLDGTNMYVAEGTAGLKAFGLTRPDWAVLGAVYETPGTAQCVKVAGGRAYVADGTNGLEIVDVSDLATMRRLGGYDTPGNATVVAVEGPLAVLVDDTSELHVLDVSDPSNVRRLGGTKVGVKDVALRSGFAFVVTSARLSVFDLTNPAQPVPIASVGLSGINFSCALSGNYAYVTGLGAGIHVLDISDPFAPKRVTGNATVPNLNVLAVRDGIVAAVGNGEMAFFHMTPAFTTVTSAGNQLELSWHAFGPTRVQSAANSLNPVWLDVPGSESTNRLTLPVTADRGFFRLASP